MMMNVVRIYISIALFVLYCDAKATYFIKKANEGNQKETINKRNVRDVQGAYISHFHIRSDIQFRYAQTVIESRVKNPDVRDSKEVEFNIILPDTAFISNFSLHDNP